MTVRVLFVDDEEDIRVSFLDHFEDQFPITLARDGVEALRILANGGDIGVVVTDIRMPQMSGLELIKASRAILPDLGFIVVSGHGEVEQVIEALRLGARNFLRKPYRLDELRQIIEQEARRFQLLQEERLRQAREKTSEQYLTAVEGLTYTLPNELGLVNSVALRLAQMMEALTICPDEQRGNVALALIEIVTNAVEHGNLAMTSARRIELQEQGHEVYLEELQRRKNDPAYRDRKVKISAAMDSTQAVIYVKDEGGGFDHESLRDPTDPEHIFLPTGRGILLAKAFLDEVTFFGNGNTVRLVKKKTSLPS